MIGAQAERAQELNHPSRDVGTARVEHRVVVSEGYFGQNLVIDVDVEGSPASVAVLHREQPVRSASDRVLDALESSVWRTQESHGNHRGVVNVGIELGAIMEGPAPWLNTG